jgi:arylsulfatase A-like enzyme
VPRDDATEADFAGAAMSLPIPRSSFRRSLTFVLLAALAAGALPSPGAGGASGGPRFPNVLLICVDTLRLDHLSSYGYERPTSPAIDELIGRGAVFTEARTVEPLTAPSSTSMLTSRFPHEHGASRNGLRIRPGLQSLPKLLAERGYRTGAFVGNWTLRDKLTGLAEHFETYEEVFSRKRWFGMFNSEATGADLTAGALEWIEDHRKEDPHRPYFLWLQYVEPHAPYRFWHELAGRLKIDAEHGASKRDRYDTEVAFTDREIGRLIEGLGGFEALSRDTLVIFVSDHGESLGEHGYWGHGRHVYEDSLHIPMAIVWPGRVPDRRIGEPALIIDLAPTVLGLLGLPAPDGFHGFDWSRVFRGDQEAPVRQGYFQAHKGAVQMDHTSSSARADGLLEVARVVGTRKEVLDVRERTVRIFDFVEDPGEVHDLAEPGAEPSRELITWYNAVRQGLLAASDIPQADLDEASRERLRALGYID